MNITTQKDAEKYFNDWLLNGKFFKNGLTYTNGINSHSAILAMIPDDKKMTGEICYLSSNLTLTNADLDPKFHKGFTIGKGRTMYWALIWHKSGHCTVFNKEYSPRWITGDTIVTVHFK